jgi:hypothetical protein
MQTPVLIKRAEQLGVCFQPASQLGLCTAADVLAHRPFVATRPADPTRALNEKRRRNPQGSASAIELECLLWRAEFGKPAFARGDAQLAEQGPHADGTDDVVLTQSLERGCDLVTDEGRHLACPDIDQRDGSRSRRRKSMDEHAPHRGQLASVGGPLALDALPVGLHRDGVRTNRRPAPHIADTVAKGLPGGAHDFVCPIQLPHTVFAHDDGERRLLDAVERGEWISVEQLATARSRYTRFATATRRLRDA